MYLVTILTNNISSSNGKPRIPGSPLSRVSQSYRHHDLGQEEMHYTSIIVGIISDLPANHASHSRYLTLPTPEWHKPCLSCHVHHMRQLDRGSSGRSSRCSGLLRIRLSRRLRDLFHFPKVFFVFFSNRARSVGNNCAQLPRRASSRARQSSQSRYQ